MIRDRGRVLPTTSSIRSASGRHPGFRLAAGGSVRSFVEGGAIEFDHDFEEVGTHGPELLCRRAAFAAALGAGVEEVNYVIPHQANGRMVECQHRRQSTSHSRAKIHQFEGRWPWWVGFWQGEREGD